MNDNNGKYYKWAFGIIIVIIGVVFAYLFSAFNRTDAKVAEYQSKIEQYQASMSDLKTDIATIKIDLVWIKTALINLQQNK